MRDVPAWVRTRADADQHPRHDHVAGHRGMSLSVFVVLGMFACLLITGLVVDGGQQVQAARLAEGTAAGAARAGANAGATARLAGRPEPAVALTAARGYLAGVPEVSGTARLDNGRVMVRTSCVRQTIFLSVVGIQQVRAEAETSAELVRGR